MEHMNAQTDEASLIDNFIHRNTKTEISNFEGSFRPCLFSRIDSDSSFESSIEDNAENFNDIFKEHRPLSKSYKPESVLKASFLTEERNSPSFKEFESSNPPKHKPENSNTEYPEYDEDETTDFLQYIKRPKDLPPGELNSTTLPDFRNKKPEDTFLPKELRNLQKEISLSTRLAKEDRVRQFAEPPKRKDKSDSLISELTAENDYLKQELQKRPTFTQYQSALSRIEELEEILSKQKSHKKDKNEAFIVKNLMEYLKLDNPSDILPTIKVLKNHKGNNKLMLRISALIKDCAPPGTFKDGPTHREIWKFIRNVMEGYIALKKNESNMVLSKIQGCLGIENSSNVLKEVLKIYNSLNFMELAFDKVKAKLGLSPHATLNEVEAALDDL